jgi:hypothetical protein
MGRKTITAEITDYIEDIKEKSQCSPLAPAAIADAIPTDGRCVSLRLTGQ